MSVINAKKQPIKRPERLSLSEKRDMVYEKFRRNLRVLRAGVSISAASLSNSLRLRSGKRIIDLEYGRANPTLDELIILSKHFKVTIDDILYKTAIIKFND